MKKLKVENTSNIKLDFFLKQNQEDVRVVLEANESTWCDEDSNTKSMILYERKNLIKISPQVEENLRHVDFLTVEPLVADVHTAWMIPPVVQVSDPIASLQSDPIITNNSTPAELPPITDAEEVTVKIIEALTGEKTEKTYKGKKRGRKKKRGPKPGMAKKKKKEAAKALKEGLGPISGTTMM